jgi:hypothetical protein
LEQNACLGIYVGPGKAAVVLAARAGGQTELLEQFAVTVPQGQPFTFAQAAKDIAAVCAEKQLVFADVAVAIDCRLYRQQVLHSEFTDYRQIAQTIKFDAEEALSINAAETAIAFEIAGRGLSGSEVATFAAPANVISEIILALQNNKLDPVSIEPDSICLRRVVQNLTKAQGDSKPVWVAVSSEKCFIILAPAQEGNAPVRAFLTGTAQNRTALLAREIMLTIATAKTGRDIQKILICDNTGRIDLGAINKQTALAVEAFDPAEIIVTKAGQQAECDSLDVVIAAGAAIGLLTKSEKIDFRPNFMPYRGRKAAFEKTLKTLSICLVILFIAIGVYLHMQYYKTNSYRNRLAGKFRTEYSIAMTGAKFTKGAEAVRKLKSEINRIKDVKSGLLSATGDDSVEAKLTFLFEAVNSVAKNVDIDIEKIAVTTKTMSITGSTSDRGSLQLFGAIDKHPKLIRGNSSYEPKEGRDYFRLTIELKQ